MGTVNTFGRIELLTEHGAPVHGIATARTGGRAASVCTDGKVAIHTPGSSEPRELTPKSKGPIRSIAFTSGGKLFFGTGGEAKLGLLDVDTGAVEAYLVGVTDEEEQGIASVAVSPDGEHMVASGGDNKVVAWETDGSRVWKKTLYKWPYRVAFSPSGRTVLVTTWDGMVLGYNVETGARKKWAETWQGGPVYDARFLHTRPCLLVAGASKPGETLRMWDPVRDVKRNLGGHHGPVHALAMSPSGLLFASGSADGTLCLWHEPTLERLDHIEISARAPSVGRFSKAVSWPPYAGYEDVSKPYAIHELAFTSDGAILVGTHGGAVLRVEVRGL